MEKMQVMKEPQAAPPLRFTQITAPQGGGETPTTQPRDMTELRGQWVLVNFWATWCAPCLTELPAFERLAARYGAGKEADEKTGEAKTGEAKVRFSVIAIAMDRDMTAQSLSGFLKKHGMAATVAGYFDEAGGMAQALRLRGYPTTWIIDPYGRIVGVLEGEAVWDSPESFAFFDSFLPADNGTAQTRSAEQKPD